MTAVIYLTNASSVAAVDRGTAKPETRACVGPGPVYSIMRWPRRYPETGTGRVLALTPPSHLAAPAIEAKRASDSSGDDPAARATADATWLNYERALRRLWTPHIERMEPGALSWGLAARPGDPRSLRWDGEPWVRLGFVPDGATLVCACSREAAAAGRCHRVVAARLLVRAGWGVVLDGEQTTRV